MAAQQEAAESWRQIATETDRERLRRTRDAWTRALSQARAAGHAAKIAALGELADPDVALDGAVPPPGTYRCRTIKIGARAEGMLDYVAYPPFRCEIAALPGGRLSFAKLGGSQRQNGVLWTDGPRRMIFLGTVELGDERAPMAYDADGERNVAGVLQRVSPRRWRLALPWPHWESNLDIMELVPFGQEGEAR